MTELSDLLAEHLAAAFPSSVVKGIDYGEVEPVMIDADIYGWAVRVSRGDGLAPGERGALERARDKLLRSLPAFPEEARPYYAHLARIASAALT